MQSGARRRWATAAVLTGLVISAFEGTVVTSAMPTIAARLGGMELYAWVFSAFLVASTLGVLLCGKLADAFGRKPVFVAGMALFLAGSALCGTAATMPALIAFRVLQGLGAGAIQPIAMTISADLYTLEERARIQALFTSAWGIASVVGPVIGGLIVVHASWRWVFLVNVPFGALAIALLVGSYRDPVVTGRRGTPRGLRSAFVAGGAAAACLAALEPSSHAPSNGGALHAALAVAAAVAVALLVAHERRAASPLVPPALLRVRTVRAGLLGGFFAGALLYASAAYVPLWTMRATAGHAAPGPLAAGAALVPLLGGWALGSSFGVRILVRHGVRVSAGGGFAIAAIGAVLLAFAVARDLPAPLAFGALATMGLGLGPASSTSLVAAQTCAPWDQRAGTTSAIYALRMLGGSLAVAALGAVGPDCGSAAQFSGIAAVGCLAFVAMVAVAPAPERSARSAPDAIAAAVAPAE